MRDVRVRLDRWGAAVVGYAMLAAWCRPLTVEAAAAVVLPAIVLVVLVVLAAHRRPRPRVVLASRYRASLSWAGLVVLFAAWEVTAALWGNDAAHPTLSLLLDPVLATYPGRIVGWIAWLGVGRWLVTR
jgi:hypothetical protein